MPKLYEDQEELQIIEGTVPSPYDYPEGCRFAERCPFAQDICIQKQPNLIQFDENSKVRCWKYSDEWQDSLAKEVVAP